MRQCRPFTAFAIVGFLFTLVVSFPLYAQEREKFTNFQGRNYDEKDLERALFPDILTRSLQPQRAQQTPWNKISVGMNVFFEFNSDQVLSKHYADLDKLGRVLEQHTQERFYIEGHTDSVGSDSYNQVLSERRAKSVKRYLTERFSIPSESLITKGFGESQPRETNETDLGRRVNRRVEVVRNVKE